MNYDLSAKILEEVKEADKILINCHRNPDPDSIGSALALFGVLKKMGKEVEVICSTKLDKNTEFLKYFKEIKTVDFKKFNFKDFDLFIVLDSSTWDMVTGAKDVLRPEGLKIITIDHHFTNDKFGDVNLIDPQVTSAAELLYKVLSDWEVKLSKETATAILAGIISDTGAFRYPGVSKETLLIASSLISKGADKEKIIFSIFNNLQINVLKMVGEMINKLELDDENKFCWCAIPLSLYEKYGKPDGAKEYASNTFIQSISATDFGIIMVEVEEKKLSVSFRSRSGFDVSKIALALGGGGHKAAAGANILGLPFEEAVKKVLETARKAANEIQNR